jgi:type IV pilus assembly protein PilB
MEKAKLGQMLLKANLISEAQLKKAVDMQKILGGKLGSIIVKLGFISDEDLTKFLAKQERLPIADLQNLIVPEDLVKRIPKEVVEKHQVLPIHSKGGVLTLAMADPTDFEAIEEVQFLANCRVEVAMSSRAQLNKAISEIFYETKAPGAASDGGAEEPEKVVIDDAMMRALIPLLIDKGIISLEELRGKAEELG